jgi:hypothetical protein
MVNTRLSDLPNDTNNNLNKAVHQIETSWIDVVQIDKSKMLILTTGQFASLSHSKFLGSTIRSSVHTMKTSEDTPWQPSLFAYTTPYLNVQKEQDILVREICFLMFAWHSIEKHLIKSDFRCFSFFICLVFKWETHIKESQKMP